MGQPVSTRRTNAERSGDTRRRILDAAVESLIEDGYAATSLRAVEARSKVSRGALLHQYPSKSSLLVDAIRYLGDQQIEEMRRIGRVDGSGRHPAEASADWIKDLWETFSTPLFSGVLELWIASRTDADLRASLRPQQQELGRTLRNIAQASTDVPEAVFHKVFDVTLTFFRGLALTTLLGTESHETYLFGQWREIVELMLRAEDGRPADQA